MLVCMCMCAYVYMCNSSVMSYFRLHSKLRCRVEVTKVKYTYSYTPLTHTNSTQNISLSLSLSHASSFLPVFFVLVTRRHFGVRSSQQRREKRRHGGGGGGRDRCRGRGRGRRGEWGGLSCCLRVRERRVPCYGHQVACAYMYVYMYISPCVYYIYLFMKSANLPKECNLTSPPLSSVYSPHPHHIPCMSATRPLPCLLPRSRAFRSRLIEITRHNLAAIDAINDRKDTHYQVRLLIIYFLLYI